MVSKKTVSWIIAGCIFASSLTLYNSVAVTEAADNHISVSKPLQKVKPLTRPEALEMDAAALAAIAQVTPDVTPDPGFTPNPDQIQAAVSPTPAPTPSDDESLWYSAKIPMKKEHQKLLWTYCQERKLDYIDMLALISTESNFDEKASSGKYKGYFQISTSHAANLSNTLKTENKILDGAININWGTAMYSWILADKRCKDITDEKKKRDIALSIYSRGAGGYDEKGLNESFLKRYYKMRSKVCEYFNL